MTTVPMPVEHAGPPPGSLPAWPFATIVIPCLNEAAHVRQCIESLAQGAYPLDRMEILIVDGGSTDGTRAVAEECARRWPFIQVLDNPRRTQAVASNLGIAASRGDVVLKLDAHADYPSGYVRECVRHLVESGADAVGGRIETLPRRDTGLGVAIAIAMSEAIGVGASAFRVAKNGAGAPRWVDTVPFACYRRDVFSRVGLFNEALDRSEDIEFHRRMSRHGCRKLFVPTIVSRYYARSDYRAFAAHAFSNGRWAILPARFHAGVVVSARHLVPLFCTLVALILAALSRVVPGASLVLATLVGVYAALITVLSLHIAWRRRRPSLVWFLPVAFVTLHGGYGLGSCVACVEVAAAFLSRGHGRPPSTGDRA